MVLRRNVIASCAGSRRGTPVWCGRVRWRAWLPPSAKRFDDDHAATAAGTGREPVGGLWRFDRRRRRYHGKQFAGTRDIGLAGGTRLRGVGIRRVGCDRIHSSGAGACRRCPHVGRPRRAYGASSCGSDCTCSHACDRCFPLDDPCCSDCVSASCHAFPCGDGCASTYGCCASAGRHVYTCGGCASANYDDCGSHYGRSCRHVDCSSYHGCSRCHDGCAVVELKRLSWTWKAPGSTFRGFPVS